MVLIGSRRPEVALAALRTGADTAQFLARQRASHLRRMRASTCSPGSTRTCGGWTSRTGCHPTSAVRDRGGGCVRGWSVAAVLLTGPVLALAWQALRTGSTARDRRMAGLHLAGATPAQVRRVAAAESGRTALLGGLAAGPAGLLLRVLLGALPPPPVSLIPSPTWWLARGVVVSRCSRAPRSAAGLIGVGAIIGVAAGSLLAVRPMARVAVRALAERLHEVTDPEHLCAA